MIQIAVSLPDNGKDLKKIKGVGKKTFEKYGEELLALVAAYRKKHGIDNVILPEFKDAPEKKPSPGKSASGSDTRQISFDMFNQGFTVAGIAEERGLVENTIQGHLCSFVETGSLDINRVLSPEKQAAIEAALGKVPDNSIKGAKKELGDNYSYGDIKLMVAYQKHLASKSSK